MTYADSGVHFRNPSRCWYTHVIIGCDHNFELLSPFVVFPGYSTEISAKAVADWFHLPFTFLSIILNHYYIVLPCKI